MKTAVVLSGEGARGGFQAALLKRALEDHGTPPDLILGISAGAINAAGYSLMGAESLVNMWRQIKTVRDIFKPDYFGIPFKSGFYSPAPAEELVDAILREYPSPKVECLVSNLSLRNEVVEWRPPTKEYIVNAMRMAGIVQASPDYFTDGGIAQMAPIGVALDHGCEKVIVVLGRSIHHATPWEPGPLFSKWGIGFGELVRVGMRAVECMLFSILKADLKMAQLKNQLPQYKQVVIEVWSASVDMFDTFAFDKVGLGIQLCEAGNFVKNDDYALRDILRTVRVKPCFNSISQ